MKENKKKRLDTKTATTMMFGVFVCLLVIGMYVATNRVKPSYALTIDEIDAKNVTSITTATETQINYKPTDGKSNWKTLVSKFKGNATTTDNKTYTIDMFCLEMLKGMPGPGVKYSPLTNSSNYVDEGIIYIVNSAYKNATNSSTNIISLDNEAFYDAQMALWIYQYLDGKIKTTDTEEQAEIDALKNMWNDIDAQNSNGSTPSKNAKVIFDYVVNARNAKANTTANAITISKGKPELKLSEDKNYYETDLLSINITTAANTIFDGFKFKFDTNNLDTVVVDSEGNTITDLATLQNKSFKVRIPASSLPAGTKTNISGEFYGVFTHKSFLAFKTSDSYQIALLATSTKLSKTQKIEINVEIPDTGVNYSQYIYIIGAMVIVMGMSIIYVNTRSKEN